MHSPLHRNPPRNPSPTYDDVVSPDYHFIVIVSLHFTSHIFHVINFFSLFSVLLLCLVLPDRQMETQDSTPRRPPILGRHSPGRKLDEDDGGVPLALAAGYCNTGVIPVLRKRGGKQGIGPNGDIHVQCTHESIFHILLLLSLSLSLAPPPSLFLDELYMTSISWVMPALMNHHGAATSNGAPNINTCRPMTYQGQGRYAGLHLGGGAGGGGPSPP